jgi:uncharacterized glyoxalase superfamily protein PhnB
MKPTPPGWPRITSALYYSDAAGMIDWLCAAFGFEIKIKVVGEGGQIEHSELAYGDGLIMLGQERTGDSRRWGTEALSPLTAHGNTQSLMVYVDDVDAHCAHARAAGARIVAEPDLHDYGAEHWADRGYAAIDPEGHLWWFSERIRSAPTA